MAEGGHQRRCEAGRFPRLSAAGAGFPQPYGGFSLPKAAARAAFSFGRRYRAAKPTFGLNDSAMESVECRFALQLASAAIGQICYLTLRSAT
jgi:hypothetical protein